MPRETQTRIGDRAPVVAQDNSPGLSVVQPITGNVPVADKAAGWNQLQNVLLGVGRGLAQNQQKQDDEAYQQGQADQQFDKVDADRQAREKKYADGVHKAAAIQQVQQGVAKVDEWAATEIPSDTPVDQKLKLVDAHLMQELGPLANDPQARREVHAQVQDYYERYAGREVIAARKRNVDDAQQAFEIKVAQAIDGANVDYPKLVDEMSGVYPGGRNEAWSNLVDIVARRAEELHDPSVLLGLPKKITTADGQTIDSPVLARQNKDRIEKAEKNIQAWQVSQAEPAKNAHFMAVEDDFNLRIRNNHEVLTMADMIPHINNQTFTGEHAEALIEKSRNEYEKWMKQQEQDKVDLDLHGATSYRHLIGAQYDGAPATMKDAQDRFDKFIDKYVVGPYSDHAGLTGDQRPDLGWKLKGQPLLVDQMLQQSQNMQMAPSILKNYIETANPSSGKDIIDRLDIYEKMKARGIQHLFMDPDVQATFDIALNAKKSGSTPDEITKDVMRAQDPAYKEVIRTNRDKMAKLLPNAKVDTVNKWFNVSYSDVANKPLVDYQMQQLADIYITKGQSVQDAVASAQERFGKTHFAVKLNGGTYVLPQSNEYDSTTASVALEAIDKTRVEYAKKYGDPNPEKSKVVITFGVNGQGTQIWLQSSDGHDLTKQPFYLPQVIQAMQKGAPAESFRKAVQAKKDAEGLQRESAQKSLPMMRRY